MHVPMSVSQNLDQKVGVNELTVITVFSGTPTLRVNVRWTARSTFWAWMMMVHAPEDIWLYETGHVDNSSPPLAVVSTLEQLYSWPFGDTRTGVTMSSSQPRVSVSSTNHICIFGIAYHDVPWKREVKVNGELEVASMRYEPPLV